LLAGSIFDSSFLAAAAAARSPVSSTSQHHRLQIAAGRHNEK
jgi:hypothetical protein